MSVSTCAYLYLHLKQIQLRKLAPNEGPGEAGWAKHLHGIAVTLTQVYRVYFSYVALSASGILSDLPL